MEIPPIWNSSFFIYELPQKSSFVLSWQEITKSIILAQTEVEICIQPQTKCILRTINSFFMYSTSFTNGSQVYTMKPRASAGQGEMGRAIYSGPVISCWTKCPWKPHQLHSQTDISACVNSVSLKMCQKLVLVVNFQFREKNFCGVAPGEF